MNKLERLFKEAYEQNKQFIGIKRAKQGFNKPTFLIIPIENVDKQLEEIQYKYNNKLISLSGEQIISYACGNSIEELISKL